MFAEHKFLNTKLNIGLLGGSFNPPHEGHVYISLQAIKRLGLDFVWWLITPQNPLKSNMDTAKQADRVHLALDITRKHQKIFISTIENKFKNCYTYNTIKKLREIFPDINFIWIMGADNLLQFSRWYRWKDITKLIPIAVFERDYINYKALNNKMAIYRGRQRCDLRKYKYYNNEPCWEFIRIKKNNLSSTNIRKKIY